LIYPLSNVTSQLKKFSSSTGNIELNTKNEIEMVSASLENIKSWYNNFLVSQYHEENQNRQRKQDLSEASEIQMSLINTDFSGFTNRKDCDLFAIYKPARIVSGDLYDFFFLDNDNLYFAIGDVSGKGISAAFFMSVAQTILKSNAKFNSPGKMVTNANNELFTNNQHQFFLTLFVGVINLKTHVMKYCNAAHTTTYVAGKNRIITELNQTHGMPLGIYPNRSYSQSEIELKQGDTVVLYSDGVTEMQNENGIHFGSENLINVLQQNNKTGAKQYLLEIDKELEKYKEKAKQSDDVTIMVIQLA
jgi:sigma-B regulation protein RsbU (phosphoserine phosphatase)